ncbi:ATPase domain-containing protein [Methanoculleus sp.]|uniref:RAD55 family ATPase n=1 Tax=Methanoculleus sp. TaxID=90427 RepID=UPI0025F9001C|nr:ATPase domain-containing protein [Methanoculleus sp.]
MADTIKRSTGIAGLDLALDGGFPPGARIIISGSPLSGLELLAQQFWQAGKETGTYLMLDTVPDEDMIDARGMDAAALAGAMRGERIVVDSLSTLIAARGIDAATRFVLEDTRGITDAGANIVYLLYTGLHTPFEEARMMRAADIFITLRHQVHGNEFERTLAIEKLKGADVPQRVIPYHIIAKGLELSTTSRVV